MMTRCSRDSCVSTPARCARPAVLPRPRRPRDRRPAPVPRRHGAQPGQPWPGGAARPGRARRDPCRREAAVNDDFERALRASLAENARHAPDGDDLAERIIDAADHPRHVSDPHRIHPSRWRGWTLPLIAAGSVAAVVAAIVGAAQLHHTTASPGTTPTPGLTSAAAVTSPPVTSPAPSEQSTTSSPPSTAPAAQG